MHVDYQPGTHHQQNAAPSQSQQALQPNQKAPNNIVFAQDSGRQQQLELNSAIFENNQRAAQLSQQLSKQRGGTVSQQHYSGAVAAKSKQRGTTKNKSPVRLSGQNLSGSSRKSQGAK